MTKESTEMEDVVEEDSSKDRSLARKALLQAVEGTGSSNDSDDDALHSPRPFLSLFESSNTSTALRPGLSIRGQRKILYESVGSFSKVTATRFFAGLEPLVATLLESDSFETDPDIPKALQYAAKLVNAYVKGLADSKTSQNKLNLIIEAFTVAQTLHDAIFDLDFCPDTQASVVAMSETLWLANIVHREHLILQALPYLTASVTSPTHDDGAKNLKRLNAIRDALLLVDFDDESSVYTRKQLISLVTSPLCLKQPDGIKLLAYILTCDKVPRNDLHLAVRAQIAQIPQNKRSLVKVYGNVYLKAWESLVEGDDGGDADAREEVEDLIGQFVFAMLHAKHKALNMNIVAFMEPFYEKQKKPAIEDLLHRVYGPLLWRSLTARNSQVREYATNVLGRVFPLQDSSHRHTEQALKDACKALTDRLRDDCPSVRMAAAEATGMVLTEFLTALPSGCATTFLNELISRHASDASSAGVRASAVKAIATVLQNPQSHALLRGLLPHLGNLIHDKVESVRLAVVKLLFVIKGIKSMKYFKIVPVDHLTSRLAAEGDLNLHGAVASGLTGLMANSYFPDGDGASGAMQMKRALTFLTKEPKAARVFYSNLSKHITVKSVIKLINMLFACLESAIRSETAAAKVGANKNKKRRRFGKGRSDEADKAHLSDDDRTGDEATRDDGASFSLSLTASIAETIDVLWQSVVGVKEYTKCKDMLLEKFTGDALLAILTHFQQNAQPSTNSGDTSSTEEEGCYRAYAAILRCAARLPPAGIKRLMPRISATLSNLPQKDGSDWVLRGTTAFIAVACLWQMTEQVGVSLASSIESVFDNEHSLNYDEPERDQQSRKRRTGSARSTSAGGIGVDIPNWPPLIALSVLDNILCGSDPSSLASREALLNSGSASAAIEKALFRATRHAELILTGTNTGIINDAEHEFILRACEMYGRFVLHKAAVSDCFTSFSESAQQLLDWTSKRVIAAFSLSTDDIEFDNASPFKSSTSSPLSPIPTGPPRRRFNRNDTPSKDPISDESVVGLSKAKRRDQEAAVFVARAFAAALLQVSCVVFAEWLAVGCAGGDQIGKAAATWIKILCIDEVGVDSQPALLPAFGRLALQLAKNADNYSLLKSLLLECHIDSPADDKSLQQIFSEVCAFKDTSILSSCVNVVVDAALEAIPSQDADGPSTSVADIDTIPKSAISSALTSFISSKPGCIELAKQLVDRLNYSGDATSEIQLKFIISTLRLIVGNDSCAWHDVVAEVIRGIPVDFNRNESLQESARELVASVTV